MAEYIERGAVLKELSKNSITKKITLADGVSIFDTIKNIPAADVVEVVRCKDCAFGRIDDEFGFVMCFCRNVPWDNKFVDYFTMSPNDYCSYGKRKEGAEK